MREYQRIRVTREEHALTITLFNPDRRNAIGPVMTSELLYALEDAKNDAGVRVVVITGEGKAFCSGGDFAEIMGGGPKSTLPIRGDFAELFTTLAKFEKPIVARVNGVAMGGGLGIVAACTFAISASDVTFATPEINVGLFPMMIMALLMRVVPRRQLFEMMLLGDKFDAEEAKRLGIVGHVVLPEKLDESVRALLAKLTAKSPIAMRLGMRAFGAQEDMNLEESLPMLRDRLTEILGTDDAKEGLTAFLEKRKPSWTGK